MAINNYDDLTFDTLYFDTLSLIEANRLLREKNKELKALNDTFGFTNNEEEVEQNINPNKQEEIDDDSLLEQLEEKENEDDEMDYYLENYRSLPDNFTKDDFLSVLPSPKHERYKEIMMRLHAESLKEKNGIVDILPLAESKEELEELKSALIKEDNKIKLIREELKSKESGEPQREIKNTIIVYPHIIDEMRDDINSEEYLHFKKLIDSIIDGTFKNVKTFNNGINKFGGISQVKLKHLQPRVAFKKLDNHTYALVTCFIKQVTRDNAYIKTYRNSITYFKTVLLDETKTSLNDPEFMLENEKRIKTLYEIMTSKQKPEGKEKQYVFK